MGLVIFLGGCDLGWKMGSMDDDEVLGECSDEEEYNRLGISVSFIDLLISFNFVNVISYPSKIR